MQKSSSTGKYPEILQAQLKQPICERINQTLNVLACVCAITSKTGWTNTGASNSNCPECPIRIYKAARGRHYDVDATMAVLEPYEKQLLHYISCERHHELYYRQIISSRLYVGLKGTFSLSRRALLNTGE